jgi:hypothetical protein
MAPLTTLLCTHCEGAGLELQPGGQVTCRYCGTVNLLDGAVCAHCEQVNPPGAEVCTNCRQTLERPCPQCGTRNWAGAQMCQACGTSLDAISQLSGRSWTDPAQRFNEQQRNAGRLKAQAAQAGDQRLAELNAMEARRLANLAAARQKQAAEQRVLMLGTAAVVLIIVLVVLLSVIFAGLR